MKYMTHVPQLWEHGKFSSVNNYRKVLSLGGKIYDDMLSRNRLYSKEELRSRLSSGDAH